MNPTAESNDARIVPQWLQIPDDINALDPSLWPVNTGRSDNGELTIADHRVGKLLDQFGSPLLVIDELDFRSRARSFADEFAGWKVYYAGKAFLCKALVRWIEQEGLYLDVCSGNELAVALEAGFPPERIEFHGNNKSLTELGKAIDVGVSQIIIDSFDEISRIEDLAKARQRGVKVLVRVTPGVKAHTHEYITTAHEDQKFGFSIQSGQALKALLACHASPQLELIGIHSHIGSQIFDTAGFKVAAYRALELMAQFKNQTGTELPELNLGGGFGIAYTMADTPLTAHQLNQELAEIIEKTRLELGLAPLQLSIEPGRAISGPAGVALYTIGTVKPVEIGEKCYRVYVAVDGGMSDNIRPALYQAQYSAILANRCSTGQPVPSRIVGKHCESGDILVHDVYLGDDIQAGDIVAVPDSGAYSRSMASNYNHATRPGVVAVNHERAWEIVRRETLADLLAFDVG